MSILALGRVFVANMTGNVVFVGFAIAGAPGFSLSASLSALAGFLLGAAAGGQLVSRRGTDRGLLLRNCVAVELPLLAAALVLALAVHSQPDSLSRNVLAALSAVAMGLQNAVVRRLRVADLTTTVLTMTLTGIVADIRAGGHGPVLRRRVLAVGAMLGGALVGALLVLHANLSAALGVVVGLLAMVTIAAVLAARRPAAWRPA